MNIKAAIIASTLALLACAPAFSQQPTEAEREKQVREYIDKEIEKYENVLELEYWQVFLLDSILTNNIGAMQAEAMQLSAAKVSNTDIYRSVQDKWDEATYQGVRKILDDGQWAKYCKMGAARDKKARDKRATSKL